MSIIATSTQRQSRRYLVASFTLASALALTYPAIPAKVYAAGNQYEWIKHVDHDLLGGQYTSAASSADGSHLIVAATEGGEGPNMTSPLFVSDDYGATWEDVAENADERIRNYWRSVDVSNDGQIMVAASEIGLELDNGLNNIAGKIVISEDAGNTWENVSPNDAEDWEAVAVSGDGSKIVALADDDHENVYISENGGDTWTTSAVDDVDQWESLSISDNGNKILVGGESTDGDTSLVYLSDNGGDNWEDISPDNGDMVFYTSTAMSSSGDKIAVSSYAYDGDDEYDAVYVSENDGASWTDISPDDPNENAWRALAMSDNGSALSVLDSNDIMYISTDGGATWAEEDPGQEDDDTNEWRSVDFNASGSRVIVASRAFAYSGYNAALDTADTTVNFGNAENGKTVVLTLPSGTTITCNSAVKESGMSAQDSGYSYPLGLVDFCFSGADASNEITLIFVTDLKPNQVAVRKYNPNTKAYSALTGASVTETTYSGQHALRVTYVITDNGPLDTDPDIGEVADPVGLGVLAVGAPNTGVGTVLQFLSKH